MSLPELSPPQRCAGVRVRRLRGSNAYTVTKGEITKFKSSPETTRGFCRTCGSTLTCETAQLPTETHFHVGTFDEPGRFEPSKHFFRNEQLPWLHLK